MRYLRDIIILTQIVFVEFHMKCRWEIVKIIIFFNMMPIVNWNLIFKNINFNFHFNMFLASYVVTDGISQTDVTRDIYLSQRCAKWSLPWSMIPYFTIQIYLLFWDLLNILHPVFIWLINNRRTSMSTAVSGYSYVQNRN